jgi:hypothetical protein
MPVIIFTILACVFLYALPEAKATPTKCEFIAVELFEAVDRGDLTEEEAMGILHRCQDKYE